MKRKKERQKLYLKAIELIKKDEVICYALGAVLADKPYSSRGGNASYRCNNDFIKEEFPEFALFEPYPSAWKWFETAEERIVTLEFCIEMCN
jgi:hypothetical protein